MSKAWGNGSAHAHHGELLQGVFEDGDRKLRRGLVSLPCPSLTSVATFTPGGDVMTIAPAACSKALRAGRLAVTVFSGGSRGGHLQIASNIPVGQGMGSSTADVLASILAVLDYLGQSASPESVMRIAVAAETACDSTLFIQHGVLFAHREGSVIEAFRKQLPALDIVSIDASPDRTISTLDHPPARYASAEIEAFRTLRSSLRLAVDLHDLALLGRVATASARINQRFLPKPHFHELSEIAVRHRAIGLQVAHSGTLIGMLFDPGSVTRDEDIGRACQAISGFGLPCREFRS